MIWILGPRAVQPDGVGDHPRGRPRGLLPDVAGGACERGRLQHPAAAEHRRAPLRQFIVCLAQVLCLVSTCQEIRSKPRPWKTETRRVCCQQESQNFELYFVNVREQQVKENSDVSKIKMYERATFSLKSLSLFSRRSVTPCPSSTPSCCGTTRTCSRSRPTRFPSWWTRRSCAEHRLQLICSWAEARPRFTCLLFTLYNQTTNKLFIARFSFSSHQCKYDIWLAKFLIKNQ